jgi:large subunit ribosomal protein L25
MKMELTVETRKRETKKESKRLRRDGWIPAVVYQRGGDSRTIAVKEAEFAAHGRSLPQGGLSTARFVLKGEGTELPAVVKGIDYNITNYDVIHLDFQELKQGEQVSVRVPIRFSGVADCAGLKLGGVLRPVIRSLKVKCDPSKIPAEFVLDVKDLMIGQTLRLRDIELGEGVTPLAKTESVVVVIAKR